MARFACIGGVNVGDRFTGSRCAVVAVKTWLPQHCGMIELRIPVIGIVAGVTRLSGGQVIGPFAYGDYIVVAIGALADHLAVIHRIDLP